MLGLSIFRLAVSVVRVTLVKINRISYGIISNEK